MRRAGWLAAATATALAVTVVVVTGDEGPPAPPPWPPLGDGVLAAGSGLQPFDDCEPLLDHLRAAALHDPASAIGGAFRDEAVAMEAAPADGADAAATAADSARLSGTSDTNVQVAGVDEPDLAETDGRRLFTVSEGTLQVVDVSGPQPRRLSSTSLDVDHGEGQLVLDGDRLLVIAQRWGDLAVPDPVADGEPAADRSMPAHGSALTTILVFDVSRDDPRLVGRTDLEGTHVAGRAVDGTAHLVVAHRPNPVPMPLMEEVWQARDDGEARSRLAAALDDTAAANWLPRLQHEDADGIVTTRPALECTDVARAAEEPATGTLQVVTLDLHGDDALPEGATAVLTDAQTVTASADQLVVATTRWDDLDQPDAAPAEPAFDAPAPAPQHADTLLHLFDLAPTGATHLASGEAPGTLLNQFSMSLHDGHLRVATTAGDAWGGDSESGVTVLRRDGDTLEVVGQVAGLGRGETIHSVRFLGDRGYVVTFRQTDPLYSLDLSDPADPRVTGELKITGYSAYLHPMPDDRLLGIGQEATLEGRVTGTQVSMFDVSDPADPRRESQVHLPGANSEGEWDHHAVLVHDGTLVLPYERWLEPTEDRPEGVDVGAVVVDVDGPLEIRGTLRPDADPDLLRETGGWQPPIRRVLVVDGRILTLTRDGTLTAWDSATLEATGTLPL